MTGSLRQIDVSVSVFTALDVRVQTLGCCAALSPTEGAVGQAKSSSTAASEQPPGFMC